MKDMEGVLFYCLFCCLISTTSQSVTASEMFQGAGEKPGLQIWRVEQNDLTPVPKERYGIFDIKGTYLVLYTSSGPAYRVHSWIGKEATQDEKDAVAIFKTDMVDYLGGKAVQYTEYQGQESKDFMSYFKDGIKYKTEEAAFGFKDVAPYGRGRERRIPEVEEY